MTNLELTKKAVETGYIIEMSEGIYAFTPKMVKLINNLKKILIEGIAETEGFQEWIFPRITPEAELKTTGWLEHHPNQAFIIHSLPNSPRLKSDRYMLDPIQCISLYSMLFKQKIDELEIFKLPIKIYETQGGWTFRNEDSLDGLFKAKAFLRIEFVYIASLQETTVIRNSILDKSIQFLNQEYNLGLDKAKGDSCFIESPPHDDDGKYREIGTAVGPYTPTIDIVFKRENEYLELASGTIAHDFIINNFEIESSNITDLSSGCFGFGLNRIALVILEKYNFNI